MLSAELAQVVGFFRQRGTPILVGVLVAALIAVVAAYAYGSVRDKKLKLQSDLEKAMADNSLTPEERVGTLERLAGQGDDKGIAYRALIALGDEYARRALVTGRKEDPAQWQAYMDSASGYYNRAIKEHLQEPLAAAWAHYGLGKLAESRDDLAAAKTEYQAVLAAKDLAGQPVVSQAELAMKELEDLAGPVRMASTAPAEPETQPSTMPAPQPEGRKRPK